jgi:hypothetical protein
MHKRPEEKVHHVCLDAPNFQAQEKNGTGDGLYWCLTYSLNHLLVCNLTVSIQVAFSTS